MVALGMLFLLLSLAATLQRKREMPCRGLLKALVWNIPLPYISIMLGWAVAEIGRQPWIDRAISLKEVFKEGLWTS